MILLFICVSIFLRFFSLNQSLWLDEAVTAQVARTVSLLQIPTVFSPSDFHPPLYYLVISLWTKVFGTGEFSLRFPSVLFSFAAAGYVYLIVRQLKNKTAGLWSALFFLINPLGLYYSQEARMYMMATALLAGAFYYYLRTVRSERTKPVDLFWFNLFCFLSLMTFYGSFFFLFALAVLYFLNHLRGGSKVNVRLWIGSVVAGAILLPLVLKQLQTAQIGLQTVGNWSLVLGKAELKNILLIPLKFVTGRISWFPKWSYYIAGGVAAVSVFYGVVQGVRKQKQLFILLVVPLAVSLVISVVTPMIQYFRFLYLLVPFSVALGIGIYKKHYLRYGALTFFFLFSSLYLFVPQFHREDWKSLSSSLPPHVPVYSILPSSQPAIAYYNPSVQLFELRDLVAKQLRGRVIIIPYAEEIYGISHTNILKEKGCLLAEQRAFRGIMREEWNCEILVQWRSLHNTPDTLPTP